MQMKKEPLNSTRDKKKIDLEKMQHSTSHLLAAAVLNLYPTTKFGIGPAIENGFYYDFDFENPISENDLVKIEKEMERIKKKNLKFIEKKYEIKKAKEIFKNQPYKLELIDDLEKDPSTSSGRGGEKKVSVYELGDFVDLCKGPHLKNTKEIGEFKLTSLAGAYWRGDEKNPMLTRIYGVVFPTKKELDKHLEMVEEAKKRDHRKLGKELDLFCFSDLVGPGLPMFKPKGVVIIDELRKYVEKVCRDHGFEKVLTPHLAKIDLYELSGHAQKFSDELFRVSSKRGHDLVIRPVLCPHHTQVYASKKRSYRDLPIRYMESEKMYRAEQAGEVGGLNRVYAITVEDGHSFCRVDQVKEEVKNIVNIIKDFYSGLGMWGNHWVSLSVRDYDHPEKYIGDPKDWDKCEKMLEEISKEMKLDAKRCEGEAALYGPKLDFMFRDSLGKEIQIPTVQMDFATPKRFDLVYTDEKGKEVNPVMVHRAILGSYERFLVLLTENFAGNFPLWLSPVQVKVLPINDKLVKYAKEIGGRLEKEDIRVEIDESSESLGKKIHNAELEKIPYMIIVGDKEKSAKKISVRSKKDGDLGSLDVGKFVEKLKKEIEEKK